MTPALGAAHATSRDTDDDAEAAARQDADPALLGELPHLGDIIPALPSRLKARLFAAFDLTILWNKTSGQATISVESPTPPSKPSPPSSTHTKTDTTTPTPSQDIPDP